MKSSITTVITVILILVLLVPLALAATKTFRVQETEFVRIHPQAVDADNDKIVYTFSEPLDPQGEWQTDYDDAGEYTIIITASDGITETKEEILLIVENKNQPPQLLENNIVVKETQTVDLKPLITDADNDVLSFVFQPPFDRNGKWQTGYEDAGRYVVTFAAHDGEFEQELRVEVEVLQTNQKPSIRDSFAEQNLVQVKENEPLHFWVDVNDADNQTLAYRWELDGEVISRSSGGTFIFNYDAAGEHTINLTISDGELQETRAWSINVEQVNRAPELALVPLTVQEGEMVTLNVPSHDLDGDTITYSFEVPFNEQGEWQTEYEDSGRYTFTVGASDGQLTAEEEVDIIVIDVDRAPQLEAPLHVDVREGEQLVIPVTLIDPDEDDITIAFQNLPEGVEFDEENQTLYWTPSYDTIHRRGGFVSNVLNTLRLEHFFLTENTVKFVMTACGKELCTSQQVDVTVQNVNRAPEFITLDDVTLTEDEEIKVEAHAIDSDGDKVRYYFTSPLSIRDGKWKTDINDEGIYTTYVTATDGVDGTTQPVQITVKKKNREPSLKIRDDDIVVNEGQQFLVHVDAIDPDNDELDIGLQNAPAGSSFNEGAFVWEPGFNVVTNASRSWKDALFRKSPFFNKKFNENQEVVWLEFSVSDGEAEVVHPVKVTIKNVNQVPQLLDYLPAESITVKTNEPVLFHAAVKDPDQDELQYEWEFGFGQDEVTGTSTVRRTFLTPGTKTVEVSVSDGVEEIEKEWTVNVQEDVYVPPVEPRLPPTFRVYVIRS